MTAITSTVTSAGFAYDLQPFETTNKPPMTVDEIRIGAFKQAIDGAPGEGGMATNLEVLFSRLGGGYENKILNYFLTFRPNIGTDISMNGHTSVFYAGATWDFKITNRMFFETSFGGAVHDGPLHEAHEASYGCTANFRESASLGYALTENWRVLGTIDHMSNGGLCDNNRGLTNAGIRLGYKF